MPLTQDGFRATVTSRIAAIVPQPMEPSVPETSEVTVRAIPTDTQRGNIKLILPQEQAAQFHVDQLAQIEIFIAPDSVHN